ncbi:carcinoembryonic antigen-related cell adhesion molecule 5-like [Poecilia latipinna]|uniref:carcinoembryonic antigen-related cell adhesion molecule 5-like n=1 Tax=Poecilia latipinna TaxID=48699 RepID=UPI00072EEDAE|nr:PREDICTED: carcinoembryonic antigen-related cell adhesion molecule 5-like [Poecilia latipinna]
MVARVLEVEFIFLSTSLLVLATCALQINHTGEVVYQDASVYGVVDKAVVLECGAVLPDLYIWSFTEPGTDAIKAVLYDLGKGPRIQKLAKMVGPVTILPNTASISIEKLPLAAHGLFTCQAFYDIEDEPIVYYYYVHLTVQVPVSKPYLVMSEASPIEGSSIWMNCSVENGSEPLQYKWQHETLNEDISDLSQNSSIITVTSISRNYTGWYHCEVSNAVNNDTSNRLLINVTYGPDEPQIDVTPFHITKHGYSALENETVSMYCEAQSNPGSQYIWFYNDSKISTRPLLAIDKLLRSHTGNYTCVAQNSHLHTQSSKTLSLTVYYPPDGSPMCSVESALNHTALRLLCSWLGGFPSLSLNWTGDPIQAGQKQVDTGQQQPRLTTNVMMLPSETLNRNSSVFTCVGSHPALQQPTQCSARSYIPPSEPLCFTNVTNDRQYLMLSCAWNGGLPKALVWWEGPGNQSKDGQENSNILLLPYGTAHSGKPYTCYAKHPLLTAAKTCRITLVSVSKPILLTSNASPKEGSSIWMHCNIGNGTEPIHYVWQHQLYNENFTTFAQGSTSFINITDIVRNQTGWYRCAAGNAVNRESSERLWLNVTFGPDVPQIDVAPTSVVQRGYTALENETVSLTCRVQSNPAGHYVWFHNDSEVYSGPQLVITKIHRLHTGDYTCVGQNSYLNTQSRKTITLTVYYPPDGSPLCSVQPVLNHTSLNLLCVWPGGLPSPSLHWTGDLIPAGQVNPLGADVLLPSGGLTANSSLFTCHGSHAALKQQMNCSTVTYIPFAEPVCFANVTDDKQFLVLSCSWGGGLPKALLWWKGPGGQGKNGEESSNVLIVRYSTFQFGKAYVCSAKHPLVNQTKTCGLTLVPVSKPSVLIRDTLPVEGATVKMHCNVENGTEPIQYVWQREIERGSITTFAQGSNSSNITMSNVNRSHTGRYRCVGSNFLNTENSDWVFLDIIFGPDVPQIEGTSYSVTDRGFSALETEPVSLSCQAQSNPASQYIWFYNNSQVFTGPQYTIAKVLRVHTGDYTCLAQNSHLNTRSRKTVGLIVYCECDL